ncbi:MAG: lipoyl(octanoyl) transferase LipB [Candidatus Thermoplasmatota archaeon]|nr:lipoyl(octanoyl) transferase LipB [Candidatus Thermoplasmatota archaeon]
MRNVELIQFSCEDHEKVDLIMKEMQKMRINDEINDTLIFVEHPEIVTIGPKAKKENILPPKDYPRKFVDRGGGLTWHGPGQLVVYPIIKWDLDDEVNTKVIISKLEEWIIKSFSELGIIGVRDERMRGVWVNGKKVASIGLSFLKWVSRHGLSINYDTPKKRVESLEGCGLEAGITSSLAANNHITNRNKIEKALINNLNSLGRKINN